jgi:hypothetical protein
MLRLRSTDPALQEDKHSSSAHGIDQQVMRGKLSFPRVRSTPSTVIIQVSFSSAIVTEAYEAAHEKRTKTPTTLVMATG